MNVEILKGLSGHGWQFARDGSTATAVFYWQDPDDPDNGWELQILKTEGHRPRFTLEPFESGLTERSEDELEQLSRILAEASSLMREWQGELPDSVDP